MRRHRATSNARFSIVVALAAIAVVIGGCAAARYQLAPSDGGRAPARAFSVRVADELVEGWLTLVDDADVGAGCVLHVRSATDGPLELGWADATVVGPDHRARPLEVLSSTPPPATLSPGAHLTVVVRAPTPISAGEELALTLPINIDGNLRTYYFRARLISR